MDAKKMMMLRIPLLLSLLLGLAAPAAAADPPDTPLPTAVLAEQTLVKAMRVNATLERGPGLRRIFVAGVENTAVRGSADYRSALLYMAQGSWRMQRCIAASTCVDMALPGRLPDALPQAVMLEVSTTSLRWRMADSKEQTLSFDMGADNPALGLRVLTADSLRENTLLPANLAPPAQPGRVELLQWSRTGTALMQRALRNRAQQKSAAESAAATRRLLQKPEGNGILGYNADGVPFFNTQHLRYHQYYVESSCARAVMAGCNFDNARAGSLRYPVPGASGIPVVDEQVSYAVPVGFVRTEVYVEGAELINVTLPLHVLFPGIVTRWLEATPAGITLHTYGEGTGKMPDVNVALSGLLWTRVDDKVFDYMRRHP